MFAMFCTALKNQSVCPAHNWMLQRDELSSSEQEKLQELRFPFPIISTWASDAAKPFETTHEKNSLANI